MGAGVLVSQGCSDDMPWTFASPVLELESQTQLWAGLVLLGPPPGRADGRPLPVSSQGRPSECVCVLTSSYEDSSPMGLGPHPCDLI